MQTSHPYVAAAIGYLLLAWTIYLIVVVGWRTVRMAHGRNVRGEDFEDGIDIDPIAGHPVACPVCGYDVRATLTQCPECGARLFNRRRYLELLRADWPAETASIRATAPDEKLVLLVKATHQLDMVKLVRKQLEARGVSAVVRRSEMLIGVARAFVYEVGVYEKDAATARAYLAKIRKHAQDSGTA